MEMIKRYAGILMMLTLLVGFTSCEDDEDIYDDLMGRTWVGDLWFGSNNNPIECGIRLDNNGLGIDYQVFVLEKKLMGNFMRTGLNLLNRKIGEDRDRTILFVR